MSSATRWERIITDWTKQTSSDSADNLKYVWNLKKNSALCDPDTLFKSHMSIWASPHQPESSLNLPKTEHLTFAKLKLASGFHKKWIITEMVFLESNQKHVQYAAQNPIYHWLEGFQIAFFMFWSNQEQTENLRLITRALKLPLLRRYSIS